MPLSLPAFTLLRPAGDGLSPTEKTMVQRHRLLCLLGALLVLVLGTLYDATNPGVSPPAWARLVVSGLFLGLFGASYATGHVRRHFPAWMQGVLYVFMGWFAIVAGLNGFAGDYDMGILLVYAILPGVVAMEAQRMRPVLRFLGVGFLLGTAGAVLGPASPLKTVAVPSSLAAVALVEGIAIRAHLSTQDQLRERERRFRGLTNSIPGVVFQAYARPGDTYGAYFVSEHAESLLGISADPEGFHERFTERIPPSHRADFRASIEEAVATETAWRQEVPFEMPSGERKWLLCASSPMRQDDELIFNGVILDITDRKEAERALREERDRFEMLFESLPTPVIRCTVEDERPLIADANSAFEEVFGVEIASVEGKNANELLLPNGDPTNGDPTNGDLSAADRERAAEIDRRLLENETSLQTEVRRAAADGARDFQLQAAGRTPADGPPELYAIYTDITEKKQYERELEKLTTRLQLALEATDTGFWEWNLETDAVFFDEACEQLFGYEPGTFPGTYEAFAGHVHPEDLARVEQRTRHAVETGERYQVDFRIRHSDGTQRWVQCGGIVEYEDGTPQRLLGIQTDITDRKQRERELRRKERRYQAIFEDPNILAGLLDSEGILLDVNQTAMEYTGASREEVLGERFWQTPWWDPEMKPVIRDKIERAAAGEYAQFEAEHVLPDGTSRSVAGIIRPVTDRSGEVVSLVVSARDITERKQRAEELLRAKEAAENANQMKSAFLANMSHEIRTPLTSIIGFAEAIGDEVEAEAEGAVPRFASLIEESGRNLLDTLNAVLNLSKLEAGEAQLTPKTVDLAAQTEKIVQQLHPQANDAAVHLHLETTPVSARADEGGLQVVLRNLVSNAIKYTEEDGQVWVRTRRTDERAVLEVEDTGIGMDPEQVPTLFEPFRQASEGTTREYEGTGLGLAVTKRVIHQMDGTIEVDTEKGRGTCFSVRLPLGDSAPNQS